ncbi:MAG: hypothetical protein GWO26_22120, partial [Phycisphaerae bacterium]|nr:hypothetical protein [Phycisphaerae bacterium]
MNTLIREGVIDLEDIPPNFMLDTINRLNVELGLKEYPDIFQQNLERNLKNWHNVLVEESNKFLKLPLQRLEFQLSMVPFEELRKRATGEQGTLADLKETFENL